MYKTVSVWLQATEEKKLKFQTGLDTVNPWIIVETHKDYSGSLSLHFDADGLRQLIFALEELERKVIEKDRKEREKDES